MTFRIEQRQAEREHVVVELGGEVDLYRAPDVKRALDAAIDAGAAGLVVDLSAVTFIDSTALGALVAAVKRLEPSGGTVALVCTDSNILKVFEITGLDRVFAIHESVDAALAGLGGGDQPEASA